MRQVKSSMSMANAAVSICNGHGLRAMLPENSEADMLELREIKLPIDKLTDEKTELKKLAAKRLGIAIVLVTLSSIILGFEGKRTRSAMFIRCT